jgi:UDP-N-acetyl-alpha-D-muramoyl-L-alanyl-L-glutamate epimerase
MAKEHPSKFIFVGHTWSSKERKATFTYELHHQQEIFSFTEILSFPQVLQLSEVPADLRETLLNNLLLALGISYYKLYCPKEIVLNKFTLTKKQAEFWNTLYTKGLGEFFYKNKLDFRGLISFPFSEEASSQAISFPRENRSLVGIGGGKDSIVTAELLKEHKKPFTSFVINSHPLQDEVITLIGGTSLVVKRELDPTLFALNNRSDTYNGHVPVSSHYAFIGLFCAVFYDFRYVIVSNEQSSNYGNVTYLGSEINHQWSKSFEFEKMLQEHVKTSITPDVTYFSLLRSLTELGITKLFVKYPHYFSHFSSCNRNFRINTPSKKRWCGECAKCAFAFVMLAAFLPKEQLLQIFGQNLFEKEELMQTYKELLGVGEVKPFDCVGTPEEVQVASYRDDPVITFFANDILPTIPDVVELQNEVLGSSSSHHIPEEFKEIII